MSDNKKIIINDKYTLDVFTNKKENRVRIRANLIEYDREQTLKMILSDEFDQACNYEECIKKAIEQKITGYKQQDTKKNIYNSITMISFQEAKKKLIDCNILCHYCYKPVKIIYRIVRDPLQWTLDRIDNKKNHSNSNTIISCLSCNLKRRNINKDKFEFSRNLIIVKVSE
jgi:hypothetical protein